MHPINRIGATAIASWASAVDPGGNAGSVCALRNAPEATEPIQELQVNSSPILNEGNYTRNPDGTITIDLPWLAIAFYGPNRVSVNVLDTNYYDFLRTRQAQQAGRPGEIPNVLDRVEGGTGLFGSFAHVTSDVEILRPDAQASP